MSRAELNESRDPNAPDAASCAVGCPLHAMLKPIFVGLGWFAAAVGSLLVAAIPYDAGESLCGVWGCFPPLPVLVAMHLFWCTVFGAILSAISHFRPGLLRPLGIVLLLATSTVATVLLWNDLSTWFGSAPVEYHSLWPRRVGYTLLTLTDVPLVQSLVAGVACLAFGRCRHHACYVEPSSARESA